MTSRHHDGKTTTSPIRKPTGPLNGCTVLVTRPLARSAEITRLLGERGATVVHCQTIEIVPPDSWASIDDAVERLDAYDWIIFTSANAVGFFFHRLAAARGSTPRGPISQSICAIGPATARVVESFGARVELRVKDSRAEGVLQEMTEHLGGRAAIIGLRFLLPCARHARDYIPVQLRKLGAHVDLVEAYQTVKPSVDLSRLFLENDITAITFTSPSTVSNFVKLVDSDVLAVTLEHILVACIGPVTAAAAAKHGFKRIVQAESANAVALVEAIARSFS